MTHEEHAERCPSQDVALVEALSDAYKSFRCKQCGELFTARCDEGEATLEACEEAEQRAAVAPI